MGASLKVRSEGLHIPKVRVANIDFTDLPNTDFVPVFEIPGDAIVTQASLTIVEAFTAASTIEVGVAGDTDSFLAATSATALAKTALPLMATGKKIGTNTLLGITSSAAQAQGKGILMVEYVEASKAMGTQG